MRFYRSTIGAVAGTAALLLVPLFAPPYYASLMIPFFAYAIALLGSICCSDTRGSSRSVTPSIGDGRAT